MVLDDLLRAGHTEAWDLLHIMCWFAPILPVEMLVLGLKDHRDISVMASEDGREPHINATFAQLIRYALIERIEPDDAIDEDSDADSRTDPRPIDTLAMHTMIQRFCCHSLNTTNLLAEWLEHAVHVFCSSYRRADSKMKQSSDGPRVYGHLTYMTHGKKLWEQCLFYTTKDRSLEHLKERLKPVIESIEQIDLSDMLSYSARAAREERLRFVGDQEVSEGVQPDNKVSKALLSCYDTRNNENQLFRIHYNLCQRSYGMAWRAGNSKTFWPAQLLPSFVEDERARILTYGYDADVLSLMDGQSGISLANHAEHFLTQLVANRRIRKANERPLLFVAHSLGDFLGKRALVHSAESSGKHSEHLRSIFVSAYAILCLAAPHTVAEWDSRLERNCSAVLPRKSIDTQCQLVDTLKRNSEILQNVDRQFLPLMSRFHIHNFRTGKPTHIKGTSQFTVNEESANLMFEDVERASINTDHSHMCEFDDYSAPGFDLVVEGIQRYAGDAPSEIAERWRIGRGYFNVMYRK